jgi:peptidoglycan hydrolase CwlO-like protein
LISSSLVIFIFLLFIVYAIPAMPEIDTTTNKLTLARNENQRLQNELDDLRRRFQGLDSRKLFVFF